MATVIERDTDRGMGTASIVAIIVLVILAAILLFRWIGVPGGGNGGATDNGTSVSGSVNVNPGGAQ